ncbi:amidase, partial [Lecanoromycetidae sp. Uapishka_2]
MEESRGPIKSGYYGYPEAKEGPKTAYKNAPASNPVLRGTPLAVAGSAVANIGLIPSFLWGNAGFNSLRKLDLTTYEPRYDPTVIPIDKKLNARDEVVTPSYNPGPKHTNRHYTIADYHAAFETGKLTPTIVAQALLKLAQSTEHKAAFLDIKRDHVLAAAEDSTQRFKDGKAIGMLDGVPVAVKDEVDLKGHTKCLGACKDYTSPHDITSWCVQKWMDNGAVIIGKLNMHELGLGGSSGGSAYAVAAGLCPVTLGADGGGSIRIPSAYCGIYGLKPSHGRVSGSPTVGLADTCGVLGPMASNMADLEYAYRIMAAPDPYNSNSLNFPNPASAAPHQRPNKIIGIYRPYFDFAEPAVLAVCNAALSHFESSGYKIIDIHLPYLPEGQLAHAMTILSEISTGITDLSGLTAANKILLSVGKQTPAADFLLAQQMRSLLMQHLAFLFQKHPGLVIVTPTTPNAGWFISGGKADLKNGISDANMSLKSMTYVWMANFLGCPALSIPVGRVEAKEGEGRVPVGLMAMGEWGDEEGLFEWGRCGEEWAWKEGQETMEKPRNWVDVIEVARVAKV